MDAAQSSGKAASDSTIRRVLKRNKYASRFARRKPCLNAASSRLSSGLHFFETSECQWYSETWEWQRNGMGCMSVNGVGRLHLIDETMDAHVYEAILSQRENYVCLETIFQQDNDPKHTSTVLIAYFAAEGIEVLNWPSNSPDLNPIEHL
ncbi:hypothetical protein GZH46_03003, partial [Fragariocoptes setiger]